MPSETGADKIRDTVREGYARIAESEPEEGSCCGPTSCCDADPSADALRLAGEIGYSLEELEALPEGANMGLSCGNPVALALLREGEVVVDLGSGGGFDVFIAGRKVGARGRAIGVDMTPEMLAKARRNMQHYRESSGLDNVEFRLGEIEHLPLADASVDVVISNCVLNLSPDKEQVWREIYRVLKPGGRAAISDMALLKPLPQALRRQSEALIGCVAGAELVSETERHAREAGFEALRLEPKTEYVDQMSKWNDPLYKEIREQLAEGETLGQYITSLSVWAEKRPGAGTACCGGAQ